MNNTAAYQIVMETMALRDRMRHGDNPRQRLLSFRLNELLPELIAIHGVIVESETDSEQ